jgi:hypothetical protein
VNLDRAVLLLAGTVTLLSALLVALVSPWWLLLTRLRRAQPAPIEHHRLLPRGRHLPPAGCQQRVRLPMSDEGAGQRDAVFASRDLDTVNSPGSDGGSQSMEDESHGSTQEVPRRAG